MRTGLPRTTLILTADEGTATRVAGSPIAQRAGCGPPRAHHLACADGRETTGIARHLHVSAANVCKWRTRFLQDRLDGLFDEPRPGAPQRITYEHVEQVVIRTLETTPRGGTHWSLQDLAKASGVSRATVSGIWRASACSHIAARRSNCRMIRCSLRKCATSSACTWIRRTTRWSCVSTKRLESRRLIAPNRSCPLRRDACPSVLFVH
jgi:hypothetical protein